MQAPDTLELQLTAAQMHELLNCIHDRMRELGRAVEYKRQHRGTMGLDMGGLYDQLTQLKALHAKFTELYLVHCATQNDSQL